MFCRWFKVCSQNVAVWTGARRGPENHRIRKSSYVFEQRGYWSFMPDLRCWKYTSRATRHRPSRPNPRHITCTRALRGRVLNNKIHHQTELHWLWPPMVLRACVLEMRETEMRDCLQPAWLFRALSRTLQRMSTSAVCYLRRATPSSQASSAERRALCLHEVQEAKAVIVRRVKNAWLWKRKYACNCSFTFVSNGISIEAIEVMSIWM